MFAYRWWVLVHIGGSFAFVLAHGASVAVALKMRFERDPDRVRALLDLSASSVAAMYGSLLVLLATGVLAGFLRDWWGQGWIWASLGILVLLMVAMYALASSYYMRVRQAVGIRTPDQVKKGIEPGPRASPEELAAILVSSRPLLILWIGVVGLALILWLMVFKPF